jgi:hypothetical protein
MAYFVTLLRYIHQNPVKAESSEFTGSTILVSVFRDSERTKSEGLDRLGELEYENLEYSCKIICEILEF